MEGAMAAFSKIFGRFHGSTYSKAPLVALFALLLAGVTGCAGTSSGPSAWSSMSLTPSPSSPFNEANIDRLRVGMSSSEVREMFGAPDEVNTAVCGPDAASHWICETWKYPSRSNKYIKNSVTFDVRSEEKRLNNWNIKRD
jgi:hypothetical protein